MPDQINQLDRLKAALADRYTIERELGRGGMAAVYLAEDLKHKRKVVLKVLKPELAAVLGAERFVQEITTTASLQHPHILPLFDSGEADGFLYYVMPYIEGETLREKLNRETQLGIEEAVKITTEVAEALDSAHRQGVIHRDIKPENILLHEGAAVVADFGIALAVHDAGGERLTETGLSLGTPDYMSPEQATGEGAIDARSDIYSLGTVLYEMLVGEPPHRAATVQATLAKLLSERPLPLRRVRDAVPESVEAAAAQALAKTPRDRFESAGTLIEALRGEATRPRKRRGVLLGGAGVVAMLAIAAIAFLFRSGEVSATASNAIAILPADARGDVGSIAAGLDVLLATGVDGVSGWRAVSPRTVMARWHERVIGSTADLETSLEVGRAAQASYAVLPTLVNVAGRIRLTAEVYGLTQGDRVAVAEATGPPDSLTALAERLAVQVMSSILTGEGEIAIDLARLTSPSPEAVRAFLEGEVLFRDFRLAAARDVYRRALEHDSAFALVHYRLMEVHSWGETVDESLIDRHQRLADRFSHRLSPRERAVVEAVSTTDTRDRAELLRRVVDAYPDDATAWYWLGETLVHEAPPLATFEEVSAAFERAVELDPNRPSFYAHAVLQQFRTGDSALAQRWAGRYRELPCARAGRKGT